MRKTRIDCVGQHFGKLTVIEYHGTNKHGQSEWLCQCDCGKQTVVTKTNLQTGNTKSCGCLHNALLIQNSTKHGETATRLYWTWHGMKARCFNPNDSRFKDYGGRGITVCDEWIRFEGFRAWAMSSGYADNLTIDRIDNDGNYCPENCRWTTNKQQANNKRTNRMVTHNGKTQTIKQWADELGINYNTLYTRLVQYGWTVEKAFGEGD